MGARAGPTTRQAPRGMSMLWRGILEHAVALTKRVAVARRGAAMAVRPGSPPTRAATGITPGRWLWTPQTPTVGTSPPVLARGRRTPVTERRHSSIAGATA